MARKRSYSPLFAPGLLVLFLMGCDSTSLESGSGGTNSETEKNTPDAGDVGDAGDTQVTPMSFFVTSVGNPKKGGNYGGLSGADLHCQTLAQNAGAKKTAWRAYLSTVGINGGQRVNARDRIGSGPWYNHAGEQVAANLDTLHSEMGIAPARMLDERGALLDDELPGENHDILTGSSEQGTPVSGETCRDWTSSEAEHNGRVGHHDWSDIPNPITKDQSWNSVHRSPCDPTGMKRDLGSGRLYCFAID